MKKNTYTRKQLLDMLALELYRINYGDTVLDLTNMIEDGNPKLAGEIIDTIFNDELKINKNELRRLIAKVKEERSGAYGPISNKFEKIEDLIEKREGSE